MPETNSTRLLIEWYKQRAHPFLQNNLSEDKLDAFDKDNARLRAMYSTIRIELSVFFLEIRGVGKRTLINAVIGGEQSIVPSGGVGPLTAQALVVRYGDQPRFEVEYYSAGQLLRTVFGLEQMYRDELGSRDKKPDDLEGANELEPAELSETNGEVDSDLFEEAASDQARIEKRESMRRRAQLLVAGNQDDERDLKYLLDCLREAAGGNRCWGTSSDERDAARSGASRTHCPSPRKSFVMPQRLARMAIS